MAQLLKKHLPGKSLILHYADYLKYVCQHYLGWNGKKDKVGRGILQKVGTDLIRQKCNMPNFHVDKIVELVKIFEDEFDYFIIPDARFQNEIYIPMGSFPNQVTTLKIVRQNFDNGLTDEQKNHVSERDLDNFKFDYTFYNIGELQHLEMLIKQYVKDNWK